MDALPLFTLFLVLLQAIQGLKLPKSITKELYCEACESMVKDIAPKLKKKSLDPLGVRIVEHMDKLCDWSTFQSGESMPSDLIKACQHFMEQHDEELEQTLYDHFKATGPQRDLVEYVCKTMSEACVGVVKKPKKEKSDKKNQPIEHINADMSDPEKAAASVIDKINKIAKEPQTGEKKEDKDQDSKKDQEKKDEAKDKESKKKEEFEVPKPGPGEPVKTVEPVLEEVIKEEL